MQRNAKPTFGNMDFVTAYASVYIYSDKERTVNLGIGSDDAWMGWFNGVYLDSSMSGVCRKSRRAQEVESIDLQEGENVLLLKVTDRLGGWNLRASIEGSLEGIFASTTRISKDATSTASVDVGVFGFSDEKQGQLVVNAPKYVDFELQDKFILTVRATDNGLGKLSDTAQIDVNVVDVNEPPAVTGSLVLDIDEDICGPADGEGCEVPVTVGSVDAVDDRQHDYQLSYSIQDGPAFVDRAGSIKLFAGVALDYEERSIYKLLVTVADAEGFAVSTQVTLRIVDVNDPPSIAPQTLSVLESARKGDACGSLPLVVTDEDEPAQTLLFRVESQEVSRGFIVDADGFVRVENVVLDFERQETHEIVVGVVEVPVAFFLAL